MSRVIYMTISASRPTLFFARLLTQMQRVLTINRLDPFPLAVFEMAHENLVGET